MTDSSQEQHAMRLEELARHVGGTVRLCDDELVVEVPAGAEERYSQLLQALRL